MPHRLIHTLFAVALLSVTGLARADVAEKAGEAKDATVQAAHRTGEVVSEAASATVAATKRVAHKTADVAVSAYDKTKQVTKEVVGTVAAKTKEAAGKVEDAVTK